MENVARMHVFASKRVIGSLGGAQFICMELACSPPVHMGLLWALQFPPTAQ